MGLMEVFVRLKLVLLDLIAELILASLLEAQEALVFLYLADA